MNDERLQVVLDAVGAITPIDRREADSKAEILKRAKELAFPFNEDADPTHLTASGFVVGTRGTILHRHRKLGIWVQPGGHIDDDEEASVAALREAHEETGLFVAHPPGGPLLLHVDVHEGPRNHIHLDLRYVLLAPAEDPNPGVDESQDVLWLNYAEAHEIAEPTLHGALTKVEQAWKDHEASWREKVESMAIEENTNP